MAKVIRLILLFMLFLTIQSGIAATTEFTVHQYDVNHIVLGEEIYSYDTTSNPRCCRTPSVVKDQDRSLLAFVSDLLVPKSTDGIFKAGRTPKASELKQYNMLKARGGNQLKQTEAPSSMSMKMEFHESRLNKAAPARLVAVTLMQS